jgi:hypothetical protein
MRIRAVSDPRLDPVFAGLSSKANYLRTFHFMVSFSQHVTECIVSRSGWLYRMSLFPMMRPLNLAPVFLYYNERGAGILSICIYVDILRKEFCSTGDMFLCSNGADRLFRAISRSYEKILTLHAEDNTLLVEVFKNLGNSLGTFLTEREHEASLILSSERIQDMLHSLPETFVWVPIYGGRQEAYVPPVNRFVGHATQQNLHRGTNWCHSSCKKNKRHLHHIMCRTWGRHPIYCQVQYCYQ